MSSRLPLSINTGERNIFKAGSKTDRVTPNPMPDLQTSSRQTQPLANSETHDQFQTGKFQLTNDLVKSEILNQNTKSLYQHKKSSLTKNGSRLFGAQDFR
jgi:hypothetical protein